MLRLQFNKKICKNATFLMIFTLFGCTYGEEGGL